MKTSPSEILIASAILLVVVVAITFLSSTSHFVLRDVIRLRKRKSKSESLESIPDEAIASSFKSHYRSLPGFAISLIAPGVYMTGMTVCSILRDHGQDIFWLPMLGACFMAALAGYISTLLHDRIVLKKLAPRTLPLITDH